MAHRALKDITYIRGIDRYGRCCRCERPFTMPPEGITSPEKAARDFQTAFDSPRMRRDSQPSHFPNRETSHAGLIGFASSFRIGALEVFTFRLAVGFLLRRVETLARRRA
jgi:hypothetical protein